MLDTYIYILHAYFISYISIFSPPRHVFLSIKINLFLTTIFIIHAFVSHSSTIFFLLCLKYISVTGDGCHRCYYFILYIYGRGSDVSCGQIFKIDILMDLHVLKFNEYEKHIFSGQSVSVYVCVCCYQYNSKKNAAEILYSIFYVCIRYKCYLKLFMMIRQKACLQGHTK